MRRTDLKASLIGIMTGKQAKVTSFILDNFKILLQFLCFQPIFQGNHKGKQGH